ncbi:glutathione-dependent formaldehyde dehydrogenase [Streptomyces sp. ICN988]|uniref:zinc-dependent alcohol dehydrogenase n=1 Tax=Streptomyces sp. ICN988 TaxID=2983765 RepID=UPI0021E3EE21|nr:zinc-dependent alcohol dehydrogenase [Streptomyces sp. ICN988]MCV2457774.1 glutathione-dependent formaldehyde dehydrogenase [Streptomyces sp. ICN988]
MKAVVWHGLGDIRLEEVPEPTIKDPYDAIVRITTSALCGTDLHFVRGTMPGMQEGRILGHEAVGVVEEVGPGVRNFRPGDRVVVPSTVACGTCSYCRAGYYAQCDNANPQGRLAGTVFFGGPEAAGGLDGLQAEFARVPFAHVGLVPLPDTVDDAQAILLSDIYPTSWFGARLADVGDGDTVAVVGAGPVGQAAVACARLQGAGRIIVVDGVADRLDVARSQHAETVNFNTEDPVEVVRNLTGGIGVDRVIEAVGVDAQRPFGGPAAEALREQAGQFDHERDEAAPERNPDGDTWVPGDAPSLAARWSVQMVAKAGTIGTIGVYPPQVQHYPFGEAFMKNLTLKTGNCNHRRYLPHLVSLVASGRLDPTPLVTRWGDAQNAVEAYRRFDRREAGWTKVVLGVTDDGAVAPGMGEAAGTGAATTAGTPGPSVEEATNVEVRRR